MATNTNPFYTYSATAGSSKTLQKPQDGGDNNQWGNYINTDLDEIVSAVNALSDKIADASENTLVDFTATTDAVNHVGITNAAAGNGPTISAAGSESDVDLNVTAKGTGDINLTPGTNGDVNIPASKGITFGDDGEKIEGDGTDLTIASSAILNVNTGSASGNDLKVNTSHLVVEGDTGNIGIGTTAPNAQLEISNDGTSGNIPTVRLNSTEGNVGDGDVLGQIDFKSADSGRSGDPAAAIKAVSSKADGTHTDLIFSTGEDSAAASEKMRITSDGNAQISDGDLSLKRGSTTASLTRQLTIGGARNGTSSKYAELVFQNYDSDGSASDYAGASISAYIDNDGSDGGELSFSTSTTISGVTEKMRIDSSGSITTPNGQFNGEIGSSATFASSLFNKGNNGYVILPSGIEIKWGETATISSIGTSTSHTHTYTSDQGGAFGTATLWGIVWTADRNASPVAVGGVSGDITVNDSNSSITFNTNNVAGSTGSNIRFLFLAIGH